MLSLRSGRENCSYSGRASHAMANRVYPPGGEPLARLQFSHWRFFTDSRERESQQVFIDLESARKLRDDLTRLLRG